MTDVRWCNRHEYHCDGGHNPPKSSHTIYLVGPPTSCHTLNFTIFGGHYPQLPTKFLRCILLVISIAGCVVKRLAIKLEVQIHLVIWQRDNHLIHTMSMESASLTEHLIATSGPLLLVFQKEVTGIKVPIVLVATIVTQTIHSPLQWLEIINPRCACARRVTVLGSRSAVSAHFRRLEAKVRYEWGTTREETRQ